MHPPKVARRALRPADLATVPAALLADPVGVLADPAGGPPDAVALVVAVAEVGGTARVGAFAPLPWKA